MRAPRRIGGAWRRLAWRRGIGSSALILCYHRVSVDGSDPWRLCVSPRHFVEQLEVLQRQTTPLALSGLLAALSGRGRLPPRAVALTFDDGYACNLHVARPALARHAIPATVFLATGAIGSTSEFWWDELEQLVLQQPRLPGALRPLVDDPVSAVRTASRGAAYRALWRWLQPLPAERRRAALDDLWAQAAARPAPRVSHRALTAAEAGTLAADDLISLGAHTVSHPVLPRLSAGEQRTEIERSKAACEALSGRPAAGFAYPHGEASAATAAAVRDAGLPCACTIAADVVASTTDPFMLPRIVVEDWDGETFARRLARGFKGGARI